MSSSANAVPRRKKTAKIFLLLGCSGRAGVEPLLHHPNEKGSGLFATPGTRREKMVKIYCLFICGGKTAVEHSPQNPKVRYQLLQLAQDIYYLSSQW